MKIRQILVNFPDKIQTDTFFDKNIGEKMKSLVKCCQKWGSFGKRLSTICCEFYKKGIIGKEQNNKKGGRMRERAS